MKTTPLIALTLLLVLPTTLAEAAGAIRVDPPSPQHRKDSEALPGGYGSATRAVETMPNELKPDPVMGWPTKAEREAAEAWLNKKWVGKNIKVRLVRADEQEAKDGKLTITGDTVEPPTRAKAIRAYGKIEKPMSLTEAKSLRGKRNQDLSGTVEKVEIPAGGTPVVIFKVR